MAWERFWENFEQIDNEQTLNIRWIEFPTLKNKKTRFF
jgi:hypothetical protein